MTRIGETRGPTESIVLDLEFSPRQEDDVRRRRRLNVFLFHLAHAVLNTNHRPLEHIGPIPCTRNVVVGDDGRRSIELHVRLEECSLCGVLDEVDEKEEEKNWVNNHPSTSVFEIDITMWCEVGLELRHLPTSKEQHITGSSPPQPEPEVS